MKELKLRGAIDVLSHAIVHIGRWELTNDWDGTYRDAAIEKADNILRKALWQVEREFRKLNG